VRPSSSQLCLRLAWVWPVMAFSLLVAWPGHAGHGARHGRAGDGGGIAPKCGMTWDGGTARDGGGGAME
jgi:uncharacterized membrane protein YgcG